MKAQDLIIGKCYVYDKDVIVLFKGIKVETKALGITREFFKTVRYEFSLPDIRIATPEEEHWYNECVKKDTFVPRDIAMASFAKTVIVSTNPAYVRCVVCDTTGALFKKGNVYKTYPGKYMQGYVYLKPDGTNTISDFPLDGAIWKFEPCEGPETSSVASSEAKTEVFGKFIIGDIVVSVRNNMPYREEGDMFTILPMSKQDVLYYKPSTNSSDPSDWRLATTKECQAYHNGVKNIKQMNNTEETPIQTKILTLQDIKVDQYYYAEYNDKKGGSAVIKSTQNGSFKFAPGVRLDADVYCSSNSWDCNKNIRLATADEITHLDCCRAHGVYMSKQRASELKITEVPIPSNAKKWAVRRTEHNYRVLNHWANSQDETASGHSSQGGWIHSINYGMSGHSKSGHYFADDIKHPDHTEISFEQFQRDYLKSDPKINVEPVITKTMNPDKWCIEMDFDHPDKREITDYMNKTYKAGMTGSGDFYYLENNIVKCNVAKPHGYDLMSIHQFKSDIMKIVTNVPVQPVTLNSLPTCWHMLVDRATPNVISPEGLPIDPNDPYAGKSIEEMLVICRQMFPVGSIVELTNNSARYKIEKPLIIQYDQFISYDGLPIIYDNHTKEFRAKRVFDSEGARSSQGFFSEPTKTLKNLPKKATLSDVSALVKHQEPVVAFSKKAKRSKLVIINK